MIKGFQFPVLTDAQVAFSSVRTNDYLLNIAKQQGFYNGHTAYNELFSTLFYKGGSVTFKEGLDEAYKAKAWRYLRALMGSFVPKHEEKEAVCALILSDLCEA